VGDNLPQATAIVVYALHAGSHKKWRLPVYVTRTVLHAIFNQSGMSLVLSGARDAMLVQTPSTQRSTTYNVTPAPSSALAHIPGDDGWPIIGNTLSILADPKGFVEKRTQRYGPVYRGRVFGQANVSLLGPDANELVLFDTQKLFSSALGWGTILDLLFPRGLMLLDFDEHRLHRRALSIAFKSGPMQSYLAKLNAGIAEKVSRWPYGRELKFYPAIKQLTLDLAATSFLGEELGPELEVVKRAFIDMVAASIAVIRKPLPGTRMARGVRGRALIVEYFNRQVPLRRQRGGEDLFSELCRATWDDGSLLSNADIVDHMSFLMMAAHDTLTSSLTSFVYYLAANPNWQEKVREEIRGPGLAPDDPLPFDRLDDLVLAEMSFKEAMRLIPPVPSIPRRAVRDFEFKGFRIPAGTGVNVDPLFTHHMPKLWPEPERYDPMRFSQQASRDRHKFAFVPFGGGAHMCLGLNFAYMQAKCFTWHFLHKFRVSVASDYEPGWRMWPIPYPNDGLLVTLAPV
jgi:cytochrome P450